MVLEHRLTQEPVEVIVQGATDDPRRLTQEPVEVAEQGTADPRRLTQVAVEVAYQQAIHRLTQGVVEAAEQVTGAPLLRRLTQIVVEVGITFPVHPFGDLPFPEHPMWSPAYIAPNVENDWFNRASFFGYHSLVLDQGRRYVWTKIQRR